MKPKYTWWNPKSWYNSQVAMKSIKGRGMYEVWGKDNVPAYGLLWEGIPHFCFSSKESLSHSHKSFILRPTPPLKQLTDWFTLAGCYCPIKKLKIKSHQNQIVENKYFCFVLVFSIISNVCVYWVYKQK